MEKRKKWYTMEYLVNGSRVQQAVFAYTLKEAKEKASKIAEVRNIEEYYVYGGR